MKNEKYPLYQIDQVNDLKELVDQVAKKYGDADAFVYEKNKELVNITYNQFKTDINVLSSSLLDLGIQNEKVAIIGNNSYEWVLIYFAVINSGNVIVPLDRELSVDQIKHILNDCGATTFVFSNDYADAATQLQADNSSIKRVIKTADILEMLKKGKGKPLQQKINKEAPAAILYTSGTTGAPKGVVLSQKNLALNAIGACQNILFSQNVLLVLPLHHSFSFTGGILVMLLSGVTIAINQSLRDIQKDIQQFKPRNILMVPLLVETFSKQIIMASKGSNDKAVLKKIATAAFGGNLTTIISGGAPLDKKYMEQFREFGITILEGYGITECSPIVAANRNHHYCDGSVGQVLSNCEVKIINPNEDGSGEICVKGETVMLEYYNNEQETKKAFEDGWFKTGDIGYVDEDGFLFLAGRKKNLIILSNGKNIHPEELEFVILNNIPYIKEVVVYAEDNKIVAEVFLDTEGDPGCATKLQDDILKVNKTLALHKNIGKTVIRDSEFPKTTTKKIKREYK